jgi:hypothetical protein
MKIPLFLTFVWTLAAAALSAAELPSAAPREELNDAAGEGKALVAELISRAPSQNTQTYGSLKIQRDEQRFDVPVSMAIKTNETGLWQNIYQTQAAPSIPSQILIIRHGANTTNAYFYAVNSAAAAEPPKPKLLGTEELYQSFAGSDFWFADLGLEFLHWPGQKLVKKEMRKGRSCRVVESINPSPGSKGYARVLSWIDFETGGLIRAEAYDRAGRQVKEFSIQKMKKVNGVWRLKQMEILNLLQDSRTLLEFDLEIPE